LIARLTECHDARLPLQRQAELQLPPFAMMKPRTRCSASSTLPFAPCPPGVARDDKAMANRAFGWTAGLGLVPAAWLVAGVVSTFLPDPESSFGWALLGSLAVVIVLIAYGSARHVRFREGAVPGSVISLAVAAGLAGLIQLLAP